jgi:hypothetical protein
MKAKMTCHPKNLLARSCLAVLVTIRFPDVLLIALLLLFIQLPASNAQDVEPFKFFRDYIGLHEDQITAIRNGQAVAKIVESRTPDEVFVFGSVYVKSTPDKYLKFALDLDELRRLPNYLAVRQFSNPPQLADLDGFTLEPDDIKQLKNCNPGRCDVQLPSELMDVFWLLRRLWRKQDHSPWNFILGLTLMTQIAIGATNVILLAPVWLQMTHLLVAKMFWLFLVLASTNLLFGPSRHSTLLKTV